MASRRSSQLSYSRKDAQYSPAERGARFNGSMSTGRAIAAAAKAAARNKAVRGIAVSAGAAAAQARGARGAGALRPLARPACVQGPGDQARPPDGRDLLRGHDHRRRAALRRVEGRRAVQAFPHVEDLATPPGAGRLRRPLAATPPPQAQQDRPAAGYRRSRRRRRSPRPSLRTSTASVPPAPGRALPPLAALRESAPGGEAERALARRPCRARITKRVTLVMCSGALTRISTHEPGRQPPAAQELQHTRPRRRA